ncbi:dockerin type I domain-containing protein, partial [Stieleria varia]
AANVVFAANSATATVTVDPTADTTVESNETVILTVSPNAAVYNVSATNGSATGTINNDDSIALNSVSVSTNTQFISEASTSNLVYTFQRTGNLNAPLSVSFTVSGSASLPGDVTSPGLANGVANFAAGVSEVNVVVQLVNDSLVETTETLVVTINPSASYSIVTNEGSVTAQIIDDDGQNSETRIIVPTVVDKPYLIPADGIPTAIIFRATADTTLTVVPVGSVSLTDQVQVLDGDLQSIGTIQNGITTAEISSGSLYSIIFPGQFNERLYSVGSSEPGALQNAQTNLLRSTDVNADGRTTALDALQIVNQLGVRHEGESAPMLQNFPDVNADGRISALDALEVINELYRQRNTSFGTQTLTNSSGRAEGEGITRDESESNVLLNAVEQHDVALVGLSKNVDAVHLVSVDEVIAEAEYSEATELTDSIELLANQAN